MAAEVSEAAQQVQLLLAAQARVAVLESELAEARQQAEAAASREGEVSDWDSGWQLAGFLRAPLVDISLGGVCTMKCMLGFAVSHPSSCFKATAPC
jgi:hypothetical protein